MSDTYIGWDGKRYPWPPPDGWYHASDGRWWAPATGPNPPTGSDQPRRSTPPHPSGHDSTPTRDKRPQGNGPTRSSEAAERDATTEISTTPAETDATAPSLSTAKPSVDTQIAGDQGRKRPTDDPRDRHDSKEPRNRATTRDRMLILGGLIGAIVIAGLAFSVLASDDTPGPTGDPLGNDADTPVMTDTIAQASSTTAVAAADQLRQIGLFRLALTDNDLTSENLTDEDILSFSDSFCGLARSSDDRAEFDDIRTGTIATSTSELSDEQLGLIIDSAVVTFCPSEADRLGLPS